MNTHTRITSGNNIGEGGKTYRGIGGRIINPYKICQEEIFTIGTSTFRYNKEKKRTKEKFTDPKNGETAYVQLIKAFPIGKNNNGESHFMKITINENTTYIPLEPISPFNWLEPLQMGDLEKTLDEKFSIEPEGHLEILKAAEYFNNLLKNKNS